MDTPERADTYAAVDLGSNSFHLLVARREHGELRTLDRIKEMVRLGGGLDAEGNLDPAVQEHIHNDLQHDQPALRESAAGCLHLLVSSASDERVLQVLGDGHPGVRQAALGNLLQQFPGDFREIALGWVGLESIIIFVGFVSLIAVFGIVFCSGVIFVDV